MNLYPISNRYRYLLTSFYPIFTRVDPDPYSEYGSGSRKILTTNPIRIHPDPQHCLQHKHFFIIEYFLNGTICVEKIPVCFRNPERFVSGGSGRYGSVYTVYDIKSLPPPPPSLNLILAQIFYFKGPRTCSKLF